MMNKPLADIENLKIQKILMKAQNYHWQTIRINAEDMRCTLTLMYSDLFRWQRIRNPSSEIDENEQSSNSEKETDGENRSISPEDR